MNELTQNPNGWSDSKIGEIKWIDDLLFNIQKGTYIPDKSLANCKLIFQYTYTFEEKSIADKGKALKKINEYLNILSRAFEIIPTEIEYHFKIAKVYDELKS